MGGTAGGGGGDCDVTLENPYGLVSMSRHCRVRCGAVSKAGGFRPGP